MEMVRRTALKFWTALNRFYSRDPSYIYPLTPEQRQSQEDEFVEAIDRDAICALASSHNKHLPCHILETARGSFNICFIVNFHTIDRTWVVRVPIEPAVYNIGEKLQSEVFTMQYIHEHTDIPIPRVYAHGHSRLHFDSPRKQAFMIIEYIDGRPLTERQLLTSTEERRHQFYSELIGVFAQLRRLEFPAAGSLMLDLSRGSEPAITGAFSIPVNTLQLDGWPTSCSPSTSTAEFVKKEFRLLWETFLLPTEDLDRATAELELFALETLEKKIIQTSIMVDGRKCGSFILTHTDLRWPNIIVDDELHIRGIIDWEWAGTVPLEFFTPPSWITTSDIIRAEFLAVLESTRDLSDSHYRLMQDWKYGNDLILHLARIFQAPPSLLDVFYKLIYPKLFTAPYKKAVPEFFNCDGNRKLLMELEGRLRSSERYTEYLKVNNLYVDDNEAQKLKEWLSKAQDMRLSNK